MGIKDREAKMRERAGMTQAQRYVHSVSPDASQRPAGDFYKTPPQGTERLLRAEAFEGLIWDPACGDGAIGRVLEAAGYRVASSDLHDRGYGEAGVDFLTTRVRPKGVRNVVTNPPFDLNKQFCARALDLGVDKVAMLMRLAVLESKNHWKNFDRGLARVHVFVGRINICRDGVMMKSWKADGSGGMVAFAWYVWEKGHEGPATVGRI